MVTASDQGVICGGDPLAGASMICLPQHPLELFLMASTPLPRTLSKWVSFEKATYTAYIYT
jgi:hypothetical protein